MKKMILIAVGVLVLVIIGGLIGGILVSTTIDSKIAEATAPPSDEDEEEVVEPIEKKDPLYSDMHPPFIVNVASNSRARFLQIDVSVMTFEKDSLEAFERNTPAIRSALLMYFGTLEAKRLQTSEGKEELRAGTLKTIQDVMTRYYGKPAIEDVFFTKLVIQ